MLIRTADIVPISDMTGLIVDDGNNRISQIHDVPYLDVVAALIEAGDKFTLFVVNRRQDQPATAEIRISGFAASGPARASTLAAPGIYAANTEEKPEEIKPVESSVTLPRYTFPPASVTVLTLVSRPPIR